MPFKRTIPPVNRDSVLSQYLRKMPVPVISSFIDRQTGEITPVRFQPGQTRLENPNREEIATLFPSGSGAVLEAAAEPLKVKGKRIAVLFSGGPASGGNNVVAGIKKVLGRENTLLGVWAGPDGLINNNLFEITAADMEQRLNLGGFSLLGSSRTKIQKEEQFQKVRQTVIDQKLDGIVVIGGDDSNTNAAFLAERLMDLHCAVVGVPKTMDGDLQVQEQNLLPISFGFHSATTVYGESVGNVAEDCESALKYIHWVQIGGRAASHVILELAFLTRPHMAIISEEIAWNHMNLDTLITAIAHRIAFRAAKEMRYSVILIPEGLIEFVPDFNALIEELKGIVKTRGEEINAIIEETRKGNANLNEGPVKKLAVEKIIDFIETAGHLTPGSDRLFHSLPDDMLETLILHRDDHGNLPVSDIETAKVLSDMVAVRIEEMKGDPQKFFDNTKYALAKEDLAVLQKSRFEVIFDDYSDKDNRFKKFKFDAKTHNYVYEGRCGAPTLFDAAFSFNLGLTAGSLVLGGHTGTMAVVNRVMDGGRANAVPLASLIGKEERKGKTEYVIAKTLVKPDDPAFVEFQQHRDDWMKNNSSRNVGAYQYNAELGGFLPLTIGLNLGYYTWTDIENNDLKQFDLGKPVRITF